MPHKNFNTDRLQFKFSDIIWWITSICVTLKVVLWLIDPNGYEIQILPRFAGILPQFAELPDPIYSFSLAYGLTFARAFLLAALIFWLWLRPILSMPLVYFASVSIYFFGQTSSNIQVFSNILVAMAAASMFMTMEIAFRRLSFKCLLIPIFCLWAAIFFYFFMWGCVTAIMHGPE